MALDLAKDKIDVKIAEKTVATYEHVGECELCGERLFACTSHPARADDLLGNFLVVYVPGGQTEKPQMYCQAHDPNRALKNSRPALDEYGRPITPGDLYTPQYMRG